jgi:hypothetical protein
MPVILATQEAEIRRISVPSQPGKIVHKTLSQKKTITKKAPGVSPEFKPQNRHKKKKKKKEGDWKVWKVIDVFGLKSFGGAEEVGGTFRNLSRMSVTGFHIV